MGSALSWQNDQIRIERRDGNAHQSFGMYVDDFVRGLHNDANGNQQVISDQTIDLSTLVAAAFQNLLVVPAYSFIEYIGLIVGTTITITGNATILGLGPHGSSPALYGGATASLVAGQALQVSGPGYVTTSTSIDLNGISSGTTLTTGTLTGGIIRFVCKYRTPTTLLYPAPAGDPVPPSTV